MKTWVWNSNSHVKAWHSDVTTVLGAGERGKDGWSSLGSQPSPTDELQVSWETLSQTIRWRVMEGDSKCWCLAFSTYVSTYHTCAHTHECGHIPTTPHTIAYDLFSNAHSKMRVGKKCTLRLETQLLIVWAGKTINSADLESDLVSPLGEDEKA